MKDLKIHSKLLELQGERVASTEVAKLLSQLREVLNLFKSSQISLAEAGRRIRKAAWRIAEDLRINDLHLSTGSDQKLVEKLPTLLKH